MTLARVEDLDQPEPTAQADENAEQAVLGAMMLDVKAVHAVMQAGLTAEDFYLTAHGEVYAAIRDLAERREPVDLVSLTAELRERGKLDAAGGPAYLTMLLNVVPSAASVLRYVRIVLDRSRRRQLWKAYAGGLQATYDLERDPETIAADVQGRVSGILTTQGSGFAPLETPLRELGHDVEQGILGAKPDLICTGFPTVDDAFGGGLERGTFNVIGGYTGHRKTTLLLNIIRHNLRTGRRIAYAGLEMTPKALVRRLAAMDLRIPSWKFKYPRKQTDCTGKPKCECCHCRFFAWQAEVAELPIYMAVSQGTFIEDLTAAFEFLFVTRGAVDLLMVDYLQCLGSRRRTEGLRQEMDTVVNALYTLAQSRNVCIVAASQMGRPDTHGARRVVKRPNRLMLKESGGIENRADSVLIVYRTEGGVHELVVDKVRDGVEGRVAPLYVEEQTGYMAEMAGGAE